MKRLVASALLLGGLSAQGVFAGGQQVDNSDGRIVDQVRMRLSTDADVKGGADEVTVEDGTVTITGRVDSDRGKSKATKLAKKVKGVKSVDNQLVVGPPK